MAKYLLDTCAAVWLMNGDPLQQPAAGELPKTLEDNGQLLISPISAWELATLAAENSIQLTLRPEAWFSSLCDLPGVGLAPLPPSVFIASTGLPGNPPADLVDKILLATVREFDLVLVTRDRKLLNYARSGHIRAMKC